MAYPDQGISTGPQQLRLRRIPADWGASEGGVSEANDTPIDGKGASALHVQTVIPDEKNKSVLKRRAPSWFGLGLVKVRISLRVEFTVR